MNLNKLQREILQDQVTRFEKYGVQPPITMTHTTRLTKADNYAASFTRYVNSMVALLEAGVIVMTESGFAKAADLQRVRQLLRGV